MTVARLSDRVEQLARSRDYMAKRNATKALSPERQAKLIERKQRQRERAERQRESLSPVDRVLADSLRIPNDRNGRCALAHELHYRPDGTERSKSEIAAMMGVTEGSIYFYFADPTMHPPRRATGNAKVQQERARRAREAPAVQFAPPDAKVNAGAQLARRRRAYGWSKAEFARRMDVPVEQVTEWENSRLRPSAGIYMKIQEVLNRG